MSEKKEITSPVKAIRAHCIECVGSAKNVKECPDVECNLFPYRFGKSPFRKGRQMTEEQKIAAAERMRKARGAKIAKNSL